MLPKPKIWVNKRLINMPKTDFYSKPIHKQEPLIIIQQPMVSVMVSNKQKIK